MSSVLMYNTFTLSFTSQFCNKTNYSTLPVFSRSKTLVSENDQHIAISKSRSSYITLTLNEFSQCTANSKKCEASSIISLMTAEAHHVIITYTPQTITCPLVKTTRTPAPNPHVNENITNYSVPKETRLYDKCRDFKSPTNFQHESVTITGMG